MIASSARRFAATLALAAFVAVGCGGDGDLARSPDLSDPTAVPSDSVVEAAGGETESDGAAPVGADAEPTTAPTPVPTTVPTPIGSTEAPAAEPTEAADETGERPGAFDQLEVGDCWDNEGQPGLAVPSAPVSCEGRHMHETVAMAELAIADGELYPGDDALTEQIFDEVCESAIEEFAGDAWNALPIRVWVWYPTVEDWNRGDRTALCTIGSSSADPESPFKTGTARAGGLQADDAVVARGVVDGRWGLFLSYRGSILHQLTSDFEIAPAATHVLDSGLLLSGTPVLDSVEGPFRPWFLPFDDLAGLSAVRIDLRSAGMMDSQLVVGSSATVFSSRANETDDWDIFIAIDDEVVQLTENPGDDRWPRVLPDESGIVYNADGRLWLMELDGSNPRPITDDSGLDFEPAISPDGTRIAFTSGRSGDEDVWTVNLDGTGLRNLTSHPSTDAWPFWSVDGERILWQTNRLGASSHLMVMTADGSDHSYFSVELLGQGAAVPPEVAAQLEAQAVPLDGRSRLPGEGDFNEIQGEPGGFGPYEHSSGRVAVALPVGWQWVEIDTGRAAQFIASERIDEFSETWAVDGVMISVIEDNDAVWRSAISSADANRCVEELRDDSAAESPSGAPLEITTIEFTCGDAAAWIVAVRNIDTQVGLLLEAQFDLLPNREADEAWILEVSQNIAWG